MSCSIRVKITLLPNIPSLTKSAKCFSHCQSIRRWFRKIRLSKFRQERNGYSTPEFSLIAQVPLGTKYYSPTSFKIYRSSYFRLKRCNNSMYSSRNVLFLSGPICPCSVCSGKPCIHLHSCCDSCGYRIFSIPPLHYGRTARRRLVTKG